MPKRNPAAKIVENPAAVQVFAIPTLMETILSYSVGSHSHPSALLNLRLVRRDWNEGLLNIVKRLPNGHPLIPRLCLDGVGKCLVKKVVERTGGLPSDTEVENLRTDHPIPAMDSRIFRRVGAQCDWAVPSYTSHEVCLEFGIWRVLSEVMTRSLVSHGAMIQDLTLSNLPEISLGPRMREIDAHCPNLTTFELSAVLNSNSGRREEEEGFTFGPHAGLRKISFNRILLDSQLPPSTHFVDGILGGLVSGATHLESLKIVSDGNLRMDLSGNSGLKELSLELYGIQTPSEVQAVVDMSLHCAGNLEVLSLSLLTDPKKTDFEPQVAPLDPLPGFPNLKTLVLDCDYTDKESVIFDALLNAYLRKVLDGGSPGLGELRLTVPRLSRRVGEVMMMGNLAFVPCTTLRVLEITLFPGVPAVSTLMDVLHRMFPNVVRMVIDNGTLDARPRGWVTHTAFGLVDSVVTTARQLTRWTQLEELDLILVYSLPLKSLKDMVEDFGEGFFNGSLRKLYVGPERDVSKAGPTPDPAFKRYRGLSFSSIELEDWCNMLLWMRAMTQVTFNNVMMLSRRRGGNDIKQRILQTIQINELPITFPNWYH